MDQGRRGGFRLPRAYCGNYHFGQMMMKRGSKRIKCWRLSRRNAQEQTSVGRDGRTKRTANNKGTEANENQAHNGTWSGSDEVVKGLLIVVDVPKCGPSSQLGYGNSGLGGRACWCEIPAASATKVHSRLVNDWDFV